MHITSLPGKYGIGDFGPSALEFADRLADAGFKLWQMLPLGPTGYGNSPYSAQSAFAGNELLISPDLLKDEGWLTEKECRFAKDEFEHANPVRVDFNHVREVKVPLLEKAASRALTDNAFCGALGEFERNNAFWLDDYAMFSVLYNRYNDARWYSIWDEKEGRRDYQTLERLKSEYEKQINICKAIQLFFDNQCKALKNYLHSKGIKSIGDIPIFVGMDSADTWSGMELFKTDGEGHFTDISGVPPDNFSPTGQLWGTPVYDWDYHLKTGFAWWIKRIKRCLELNDIVRIDHFRGLAAYYDIPAGSKTAEYGVWTPSPGKELFMAMKKELGDLPIIAEDLGNITSDVIELRKSNGFPGMKISQFGFDLTKQGKLRLTHEFLPRNYNRSCVAYTGTHDNNTTRGWFDSLPTRLAGKVLEYLDTDRESVVKALIWCLLESRADTVIIPMQDILELDTTARMNYPSSCNDINWSWRMNDGAFNNEIVKRYRKLTRREN